MFHPFDREAHKRHARTATLAFGALLDALGNGVHHLTCSAILPARNVVATLHVEREGDTVCIRESAAMEFAHTLFLGLLPTADGGGLVSRTAADGRTEILRGWKLSDEWPQPLSEAEVFNAYCTDARTGEPIPPEPCVVYCPGLYLPNPGDL
ncbi:hypothetical protein ACWGCW_31590 [Streptomyces sp. NPDC054933]